MNWKKNKFKLLSILSLGLVAGTALAFSYTYSSYVIMDKIDQQVGYQGKLDKTIYFNANIWDKDGAEFYIYCYNANSNVWVNSYKFITPTINVGGNDIAFSLFLFHFDDSTYTGFNFVRINPNGQNAPSWEAAWNQTGNITSSYYNNYNYYCIDSWGDNNYIPSTNNLVVSNGELVFSN